MKKGDKVIVIRSGLTYSTNDTAFRDFGLKDKVRNPSFKEGTIATIFKTGLVNGHDMSAAIRDEYGNESVISFNGIKLYEMKLEITKEKVLEAASKCSQAKETLKTLFPEVFEEENPKITCKDQQFFIDGKSAIYIEDGGFGEQGKEFHLDSRWIWMIENAPIGYQLKFKKINKS